MTMAETGTAKAPRQRAGQAIITQRATYNAKPGANRKQHTVVGVVRGWCCGTPSAVDGATSPLPVAMGGMSQIATQHGNAAVRVSCCQLMFMQIGKARFMRQRAWQTSKTVRYRIFGLTQCLCSEQTILSIGPSSQCTSA